MIFSLFIHIGEMRYSLYFALKFLFFTAFWKIIRRFYEMGLYRNAGILCTKKKFLFYHGKSVRRFNMIAAEVILWIFQIFSRIFHKIIITWSVLNKNGSLYLQKIHMMISTVQFDTVTSIKSLNQFWLRKLRTLFMVL